jgi:hypothetical protein
MSGGERAEVFDELEHGDLVGWSHFTEIFENTYAALVRFLDEEK